MSSMSSDLLRALADDLDAEDGEDIGIVIITQEDEDEDAMMSSNIPQDQTHNLLEAMLSRLTAPTYH